MTAPETTVVDVLENFYEEDLDVICRRYEVAVSRGQSIDAPELRVRELVEVHRETWAELWPTSEADLPLIEPGELRPLVPPRLRMEAGMAGVRAAGGAPFLHPNLLLNGDPWDAGKTLAEVKRNLLYHHSVVLLDKLQNVGVRKSVLTGTLLSLTEWLKVLAYAKDLIRRGVVYVAPFASAGAMYSDLVMSRTPPRWSLGIAHESIAQDIVFDHVLAINDSFYMDIGQGLYWTPGRCSVWLPENQVAAMTESLKRQFTTAPEFVQALAEVQAQPLGAWLVPDVDELRTTHIATLRDADCFGVFRATLRSAMQAAPCREVPQRSAARLRRAHARRGGGTRAGCAAGLGREAHSREGSEVVHRGARRRLSGGLAGRGGGASGSGDDGRVAGAAPCDPGDGTRASLRSARVERWDA